MTQRDASDADPVLEAEVERALLPYRSLLPPELLEEMQRLLRLGATTHPYPTQLMRQIRPPANVEESGEVGIGAELAKPSTMPPISEPVSSGMRRRGGGR